MIKFDCPHCGIENTDSAEGLEVGRNTLYCQDCNARLFVYLASHPVVERVETDDVQPNQ